MSKIEELFESYWAGVMQGKHPTYKLFRWHHKNGFMAGSNAVLEEIKKYIKEATQEHEVGLIWISGLINLIEQLKKG